MNAVSNAVSSAVSNAVNLALDIIAPARCAMCAQPVHVSQPVQATAHGLCTWCLHALPGTAQLRCHQCAIAVSSRSLRGNLCRPTCTDCHRERPPFDATIALADYAPGLDRMIHRLKYRQHLSIAKVLGQALAQQARRQIAVPGWPTRLVPVPLSAARLRERGYNQSALLARAIGKQLAVAVDQQSLHRIQVGGREAEPQAGKPRGQRISDTAHLFFSGQTVIGERIALVDDVMTSGATLAACAHALKDAGASQVINLVVARTPKERAERSGSAKSGDD